MVKLLLIFSTRVGRQEFNHVPSLPPLSSAFHPPSRLEGVDVSLSVWKKFPLQQNLFLPKKAHTSLSFLRNINTDGMKEIQ